jgi:hypothetical protein
MKPRHPQLSRTRSAQRAASRDAREDEHKRLREGLRALKAGPGACPECKEPAYFDRETILGAEVPTGRGCERCGVWFPLDKGKEG